MAESVKVITNMPEMGDENLEAGDRLSHTVKKHLRMRSAGLACLLAGLVFALQGLAFAADSMVAGADADPVSPAQRIDRQDRAANSPATAGLRA